MSTVKPLWIILHNGVSPRSFNYDFFGIIRPHLDDSGSVIWLLWLGNPYFSVHCSPARGAMIDEVRSFVGKTPRSWSSDRFVQRRASQHPFRSECPWWCVWWKWDQRDGSVTYERQLWKDQKSWTLNLDSRTYHQRWRFQFGKWMDVIVDDTNI